MRYYKQKHYKNVLVGFEFFQLGADWQVLLYNNTRFISLKDGKLVVKYGYAWDGASGPVFQTKTLIAASLLHDALYQILRDLKIEDGRYREEADEMLRDYYLELCLKSYPTNSLKHRALKKLAKTRSRYIFWAVRKFGEQANKKANKPRKIYEV